MILFDWCAQQGVRDVFSLIKGILKIIRIVVPIGLALLTAYDLFKNVINPENKDGQAKILRRLAAAILVFFTPLLVRFVLKLVDIGGGNTNYSSCWESVK